MNKLKLLQQEYKAIKADYESALQLVDNYMESTGIDFYDKVNTFYKINFIILISNKVIKYIILNI